MKGFYYALILIGVFLLGYFTNTYAQNDTWIATNTGIADYAAGEKFEVAEILALDNGRVFAFIEEHSKGENFNGVYELNKTNWTWTRIAPPTSKYGFSRVITDQNRVFEIREGTLVELDFANARWNQILKVENIGIPNTADVSVIGNKFYFRSRLEGSNLTENQKKRPEANFQENEEFITVVDISNRSYEFLRNPSNPLIIGSRGGNYNMSIVLADGKAFINNTFDLRDKDGYGGLYEWDGKNWISASSGLNAINITGSGFGPTGPIYTDISKKRLFVRTEQGFYEKIDKGWYKFFYRTSANFFITPDFLFINNNDGSFNKVDRAINQYFPSKGVNCISAVRSFMTPDNGGFFLAEIEVKTDNVGNCVDDINAKKQIGIYRYIPDNNKVGRVQNLHLETGTYIGGKGANTVAETGINNAGKILVAGTFQDNMGTTPTTLFGASTSGKGKLYVMNEWGTAVERTIVLGEAIYDMDIEETTQEIALAGSFGVAVLNADFTLKWHRADTLDASPEASYRGRVAIAANGNVVAILKNKIRLYAPDGVTLHDNTESFKSGIKVYDIEISSDANHNQYYACGFTQANSNLQVAFLYAYELTVTVTRKWKTWGFSVGGAEGLSLSTNGADTRAYRIKAVNGGDVYVAGESAGGGPGGFTIFAYNGKDLTTKVAHQGNDFFTDGTNSQGANHITFLARINPADGVVKKGKFFHARLSNGKTNTHRTRYGDLEIDNEGYAYLVGESSSQMQDRDVFNINGKLIEKYSGDLYVLMTTPNFDTRILWGAFPKDNRGGGSHNRIAVGNGKVAYVATTTRGEMMTTDNALQKEPYNIVRVPNATDTLNATDVYLATWKRNVWETANLDKIQYPFIAADSCFRVDDKPCPTSLQEGQTVADAITPFNIISPNGDGQNDTWQIENLQVIRGSYQVKVFTQSGQIIFETQDYLQTPWDGTHNGQTLPNGTYYYVITFSETSKIRNGYITLIQ